MSMESVARKVCSLSVKEMLCLIMALQLVTLGAPIPVRASGNGNRGNENSADSKTRTPIKHVIMIIGENRTFDHVFATYKPKGKQTVWNLLSKGIVNEDGTPGVNYPRAAQNSAVDSTPHPFEESPMSKSLFLVLPVPLTGGPSSPIFSTVAQAQAAENGLAPGYYKFLTTGGTGQLGGVPDARISYDGEGATSLPDGPFQLTPGIPYDGYAASPVHRFYQMQFSFPSGHSITAFALALVLGSFYPEFQVPLLVIATSIALSRIILGMHFLSDVLAGSAIGILIGYTCFYLFAHA